MGNGVKEYGRVYERVRQRRCGYGAAWQVVEPAIDGGMSVQGAFRVPAGVAGVHHQRCSYARADSPSFCHEVMRPGRLIRNVPHARGACSYAYLGCGTHRSHHKFCAHTRYDLADMRCSHMICACMHACMKHASRARHHLSGMIYNCVWLQVLPSIGCILPDDPSLISPSQLHGSLLTHVFSHEDLRNAWWAAEAAAATDAASAALITDEGQWLRAPPGEGELLAEDGGGAAEEAGWLRDTVPSETAVHMHALLQQLLGRCMWLGITTARMLMVQVVLGAALRVRAAADRLGCP